MGFTLLLAGLPGLAFAVDAPTPAARGRPDKTEEAKRRLAAAQDILTATQALERLEAQQPPAGDRALAAARKTLREALERLAADATVRATPAEEASRLELVAREVERRRALRETAVDEIGPAASAHATGSLEMETGLVRELVDAIRLQRELKVRVPSASEGELAAAQNAVIRAEERQPKSKLYTSTPTSPENIVQLRIISEVISARRTLRQLQARNPAASEAELTTAREAVSHAEASQTIVGEVLQQAEDRFLHSRPQDASLTAEEKAWWEAAGKVVTANRKTRSLQTKGAKTTAEELTAAREEYNRAANELRQRVLDLWKSRLAGGTETASASTTTLILSPADEAKRLAAVASEVARRREIREKTGSKPASITTATALPQNTDADKASGKSILRLPNASIQSVAEACEIYFGRPIKVADRVGTRTLSLEITAETPAALRSKLREELGKQGLYLIERPEGFLLDIEPASTPPAKSPSVK